MHYHEIQKHFNRNKLQIMNDSLCLTAQHINAKIKNVLIFKGMKTVQYLWVLYYISCMNRTEMKWVKPIIKQIIL